MRTSRFALFFLLCVFFLTGNVSARTFVDDMDMLDNNNIKQYHNLAYRVFRGNASGLPDPTACTFSDLSSPYGWVQYRVTDCTAISAGIYSATGTFVSALYDDPSAYALGMYPGNMHSVSAQAAPQALICLAVNAVYTATGGLKQAFVQNNMRVVFGPAQAQPASVMTGYGINFTYSLDGTTFLPLPANRAKIVVIGNLEYCYEEFTAAVPASAKYVRAEINDVTSLPYMSGGMLQKQEASRYTALTSVTLSGDKLYLGEPEETFSGSSVAGNIYIWTYAEEEEPSSKSQSPAPSSLPDTPAPSAAASPKSAASPSSKFEGTITSSSRASQLPRTAASSSKSPEKPESPSSGPAPPQASAEVRETPVIYEIPRTEEDRRFNTGVVAYIVVVSGGIVLLVALPKSR